MFTRKKLWLAAATVTVLATASITPAQAITLDFHFTSPLPTGSVVTGNEGSFTIDDRITVYSGGNYSEEALTNLNVNQGAIGFSTLSLSNSLGTIKGGFTTIVRLPDQWNFQGTGVVLFSNQSPAHTGISWRMNISCSLNLISCTPRNGSLWVRFGSSPSSPISYNGGIVVDRISLTPIPTPIPTPTPTPSPTPPPNSVPEPSSVLGLLLLSSTELLRRKLRFG